MPQLPSGRHIALTAARLADLARKYEETGEPAAIGQVRSRDDVEAYIDVLYFRPASGDQPVDSSLPAGLEAYPSGFTLATIGEEARSWPKEDREAFAAFLRRPGNRRSAQVRFCARAQRPDRTKARDGRRAGRGRHDDGGNRFHDG